MSILLSGPAGAGKSALARRLRDEAAGPTVIADFQALYAALSGDERGPDGRYPLRDERLLPVVEYTRRATITGARERGIDVVATNSDGDPARRAMLLAELGPGAVERIEDPGREVVAARLADSTGKLSRECEAAMDRWYGRVRTEDLGDVEHRYAPFEFRMADAGPGVLAGVAMPYGAIADLGGGLRERFEAGAFGEVAALDVVVNRQHDRGQPLGRTGGGGLTLTDGPDALRAELVLPDTAHGRDVAVLASRRVLRGFSVEFRGEVERFDAGVRVVARAALLGLAVVDRPAYGEALANLRARVLDTARPRRRVWL